MNDAQLVAFLQSVLPRLRLRWLGFRKVRGTVRKRLARRMTEIGVSDLTAYQARLERDPAEWTALDELCRIPISRLYRDKAIFDEVVRVILPERAREARRAGRAVRVWSAGCASGEEPYTAALAWQLEVAPSFEDVALDLLATDVDDGMLERARTGCYASSSLRELPERWRAWGFTRNDHLYCVRDELRAIPRFRREDLRTGAPDGPFDLVFCRNVAFTYFDEQVQRSVTERIVDRLLPRGVLVVGAHESLPAGISRVSLRARCIYGRSADQN